MAVKTFCNGCNKELYVAGEQRPRSNNAELIIEGKRANYPQQGGEVPNGDFHWCLRCAQIAFKAVEVDNLSRTGWER